ncbi:MAG: MaoC family dehydratase [Actinomycetota bacterium]|nr:MaoC family dehydratase [Actinomycetota bacterium]
MASPVAGADVAVGTELPPGSFVVTRADLVRYAGASGDFNVIHWNQRVAQSVGLPDVIAHGMLTMALAARVVTDWVVDPAAVLEYSARFTRPVPVPDDDVGATLDVSAKVTERLDDRRARIELTATCGGDKVLGMARVLVQLS